MTAAVQLYHPPHRLQRLPVLRAIERGEHPGEIARRGDRRPNSASERLARGATAEVVVASRSSRLWHELQLTRARRELEYPIGREVAVERDGAAIRSPG